MPGYFASNAATIGRTIWLTMRPVYQTTWPSLRAASSVAGSTPAAQASAGNNNSAAIHANRIVSPILLHDCAPVAVTWRDVHNWRHSVRRRSREFHDDGRIHWHDPS